VWVCVVVVGGGQAINFTLSASAPVATVVSTVLTSVTTRGSAPLPVALRAGDGGLRTVAAVQARARQFWREFWNRSALSLPGHPAVERFWFAAQALVGMASRAGRVAPGLWGPWVSTDSPAWCGGYTLVSVP
jgi:alpha-L-fucosidase 2